MPKKTKNLKLKINNIVKLVFKNAELSSKIGNSPYIWTQHLLAGLLRTNQAYSNFFLNERGVFVSDLPIFLNYKNNKTKEIDPKSKLTYKVIEAIIFSEIIRDYFKVEQINSTILLLWLMVQEKSFLKKIFLDIDLETKYLLSNLMTDIKNWVSIHEDFFESNGQLLDNDIFENLDEDENDYLDDDFEKSFLKLREKTINIYNISGNNFGFDKILEKKDTIIKKIEEIEKEEEKRKEELTGDNNNTPFLDKFTTDLTAEAKSGKYNKIVGRENEIKRVINILYRRTKNNPVLTGEPGVGKTAIVEGLAWWIANKKVSKVLWDKRILRLDLTLMIAGTMYRGEFESRISGVLKELTKLDNVVLFIDELHMIIGAGGPEGSMDVANILKPVLARGEIQVIGATTTDEYMKHIEKDSALERRFQQVYIKESTIEETIEIIQGIKNIYEDFHGLKISNKSIEEAVLLSKRYITDRFLPDKAIDIIDEACSLKGGNKKTGIKNIKKIKTDILELRKKREKAVLNLDFEKAQKRKNDEHKLEEKLKILKNKKNSIIKKGKELTEKDIAQVITQITGIPVSKLLKSEVKKVLNLEKILKKKIIGQDEVLTEISQAIRRVKAGVTRQIKPLGSFMFLWPSGVGKTLTTKVLAEELFDNEDSLIRLDMSEFMEQNSVNQLIGSPPGYVGYQEGGRLSKAITKNPYAIILLDEVEKAHRDVLNLFLQVLDEGIITDNQGRKLNFKNSIIIMTSNIGTEYLTNQASRLGFATTKKEEEEAEQDYKIAKDRTLEQLRERFRPELLNRIDSIIVFKALPHKDLKTITALQLKELNEHLESKQISLKWNNKVLDYIAKKWFDKVFGARNIARLIQQEIENKLAEKILLEKFGEVKLVVKNDKLLLV